ncbi:MAG: hypothetical protein QOF72_1696 [Blastocatellia bacterium]|jgi:uncharacterized SAM-binding protein YcdF (DUF218 family)|nr:hypothetical protein [Blastocatellia bacterium]
MNHRTRALAEKIWDYHQLKHHLEKADVILVLCSHDRKVAARGAELFLDQWAPLLIFSGGLGSITRNIWTEPEADQFARIAIELGVPKDRILVENRSTNTGENIRFTREMLNGLTIDPQSFILVQKPYMERRSFATFRKLWPEKSVRVTSPQVTFDEYLDSYAELSAKDVVGIMVGDLQRIRVYAERGFQIAQEIPGDVWCAYEELVRDGYDHYLIGE